MFSSIGNRVGLGGFERLGWDMICGEYACGHGLGGVAGLQQGMFCRSLLLRPVGCSAAALMFIQYCTNIAAAELVQT